jgi:hypothetical protein
VGEPITVVPHNGLEPIQLTIISVEKVEYEEIEEMSWHVELSPVQADAYRTAPPETGRANQFPFDATLLYPAQPQARSIAPKQLKSLPKSVVIHQVEVAIDINQDGQADGIRTSYYCKCPEIPRGPDACEHCDCDYTCGETYMRQGESWKEIANVQPM